MKTFEEILNTVTCNGMRELTYERARQIAMEYASQFIDKAADLADTTLLNETQVVEEIYKLKKELK